MIHGENGVNPGVTQASVAALPPFFTTEHRRHSQQSSVIHNSSVIHASVIHASAIHASGSVPRLKKALSTVC